MEQKSVEEFNKRWRDIAKEFDWAKVHSVYVATEWKWHSANGIPSIGDIIANAHRLLFYAYMNDTTTSTGGLQASYEDNFLSLSMVIHEVNLEL